MIKKSHSCFSEICFSGKTNFVCLTYLNRVSVLTRTPNHHCAAVNGVKSLCKPAFHGFRTGLKIHFCTRKQDLKRQRLWCIHTFPLRNVFSVALSCCVNLVWICLYLHSLPVEVDSFDGNTEIILSNVTKWALPLSSTGLPHYGNSP